MLHIVSEVLIISDFLAQNRRMQLAGRCDGPVYSVPSCPCSKWYTHSHTTYRSYTSRVFDCIQSGFIHITSDRLRNSLELTEVFPRLSDNVGCQRFISLGRDFGHQPQLCHYSFIVRRLTFPPSISASSASVRVGFCVSKSLTLSISDIVRFRLRPVR